MTTVITGNRIWRSMSSSESRRQEVMEQIWYAAEDCFRSVQRRLEKLGRRRLRVGYGEQTVHETNCNAETFKSPTLLDDEVRQRGMIVPGHEDTCKPERPACNLSAMELSARVICVVLSLSRIATCTHRPPEVIIAGIYMSSNIYYLLLLYLNRKELCRRVGLQMFNCDIFAKLSQLDFCRPTHLHHSFLLQYNNKYLRTRKCPRLLI